MAEATISTERRQPAGALGVSVGLYSAISALVEPCGATGDLKYPLLFLLNTPVMPAPVGLERHLHLIGQRKGSANPGINFRRAEREMQVDDGFPMPQLYPPTGKIVVGHPAGKGMRKRFPKPPMIVADRIGFVTGNGKAQQFPVHIPEQPPFCSHPSITSTYQDRTSCGPFSVHRRKRKPASTGFSANTLMLFFDGRHF